MTHYYFDAEYYRDYVSTIGPNEVPSLLAFTIDDEAVIDAKNALSSLPQDTVIRLPVDVFHVTPDLCGKLRVDRAIDSYSAFFSVDLSEDHNLYVEYESSGVEPELIQLDIQLTPEMIISDEVMNDLNGAPYNSSMEL